MSAGGGKRERTRYTRYAKLTFRKDRRLNIRLSSKDLEDPRFVSPGPASASAPRHPAGPFRRAREVGEERRRPLTAACRSLTVA